MLNRILSMALSAVLGQVIEQRVRKGSIAAVKNYIQLVRLARMATLGLVGLSVAAAVLVAGILLVVVGIVGLLPIEPNTVAIILLSVGALLTLIAAIGFGFAFNEKRWLEVSKAYELMDVALGPWDGILPPNPLEILLQQDSPKPTVPAPSEARIESRLMPIEEPKASAAEIAELKAKSVVKKATERSIRVDYPQGDLAPV